MRLIDADALRDAAREVYTGTPENDWMLMVLDLLIRSAPTIETEKERET